MLSDGAADLLRLLRVGSPLTRSEVGDTTGWARATVNSRIDELLASGLLRTVAATGGTRGRPAARFTLDPSAGRMMIADIGASGARLARCDLAGTVLAQETLRLWIGDGPDAVLGTVSEHLKELFAEDSTPVWAAGISLPGPIESAAGRVVSPPIMTGWDGLAVPEWLEPVLGAPVLVENDSNAMAWGEYVLTSPRVDDLLFVKVGTGVGAGIVANGRILRGAQGASGDLGHTRGEPPSPETLLPLCRCGKLGCVEAYAGGWAIARDLTADGEQAQNLHDVLGLLRHGNAHAVRRVRDAGRVLGAALAHAVSLLNPSEIVVGGQLAAAGEHLLAGIREHVAARALPLATRDLRIRLSHMPNHAGVAGMADATASWLVQPHQLPGVLNRVFPPAISFQLDLVGPATNPTRASKLSASVAAAAIAEGP